MHLSYPNKQAADTLRAAIPTGQLHPAPCEAPACWLIEGDNLGVMQALIDQQGLGGKIDLVYIDPPFATQNTFSLSDGRASTISPAGNGSLAYTDALTGPAFLEFLRARLYLLHELLSEQGSIYLHIDYKVGHYVKVIMDEVFGAEHFRNDLTRIKCNPKNFKRRGYGNYKDLILFYSKGPQPIWQEPYQPYSEADLERLFPRIDAQGRRYTTIPLHAPGETQKGKTAQPFRGISPPAGRHWRSEVAVLEAWDAQGLIEWSSTGNPRKKIYPEDRPGKRVQDIWEFKDPQYPRYPTEKPLALLQRIVAASSAPGSWVLDAFGGSGVTLEAAALAGRRGIGIDQSPEALRASRARLQAADLKFQALRWQVP